MLVAAAAQGQAGICTADETVVAPNPVTAGNPASISSHAWQLASGTGCTAGTANAAVTNGDSHIQVRKAADLFVDCASARYCTAGNVGAACTTDVSCNTQLVNGTCTDADWISLDTAVAMSSGYATYAFNTTGLGGKVIGFRSKYNGSGNLTPKFKASTGFTPCVPLTVSAPPACAAPLTIAATRASGDGMPGPGPDKTTPVGPWTFRISIHACEAVTNVTAQGGDNGWAPTPSNGSGLSPDKGTAVIKKQNNKNNVILWTIGNMAAGTDASLTVTVNGPIPPGTPDCQVRYLSGAWSALYSTNGGVTINKSSYTDRVSIQVDVQGDDTCP